MSNPQSEPRLKDRQNPSHNDRENSTLGGGGGGYEQSSRGWNGCDRSRCPEPKPTGGLAQSVGWGQTSEGIISQLVSYRMMLYRIDFKRQREPAG